MKSTIKLDLRKIIVVLCGIYPLIAEINDYIKKSISIPYIVMICIILLVTIGHKRIPINKNNLFAILTFSIFTVVSIFVSGAYSDYQPYYSFPLKMLINLFLFSLFLIAYKGKVLSGKDFYSALNISSWFFICCLIVPKLFNVGSSVYAGNLGYKAFYQAQNEISAVIIILFYFSLYALSIKINNSEKGLFLALSQTILLFICAMLVSTKSVLVYCFIGIIYCVIELLLKVRWKYKIYIIVFISLCWFFMKDQIFSVWEGVSYRYNTQLINNYGNNTLTAIFSSRNAFVSAEWANLISSNFVFLGFLIGNGFRFAKQVELDPIDMFFSLGVIGIVSLVIFLIYIFANSRQNFQRDKTKLRLIAYICMIFYMSLAGHVIFYTFSGFYFVLMCVFNVSFCEDDIS